MARNFKTTLRPKTPAAVAAAFVVAMTIAWAAASAQATVFYADGGSGDHAELYTCPDGYVLTGFYGKTGYWIDQIGLVCSDLLGPAFTTRGVKRVPPRGGNTGTQIEQHCPRDSAIRTTSYVMIRDKDQPLLVEGRWHPYVAAIHFTCFSPKDGTQASGTITYGYQATSKQHDYIDRLHAPDQCPGNEYATGLNIRYGKHVNAVGLICAAIAPAQPVIVAIAAPAVLEAGMENDTDRPGSDYRSFPGENGKPVVCQRACKADQNRCRAWTYVHPGLQGPNAMCHLKHTKPAPRVDKCCISGVVLTVGGGAAQDPGGLAPQQPSSPPPFITPPILPSAPLPGATGPRNCKSGFVWRLARSTDYVCVTPESRTLVEQENAVAPSRWDPNGAYGPQTCIAGFVWREAFDGDTVCVTPERRAAVKEENRVGPIRTE